MRIKYLSGSLVLAILLLIGTGVVYAKILSKEMVNKAVLESGLSSDICPISLANPMDNASKVFENTEAFPCIGDNEEFRFGEVSLYLKQELADSPPKAIEHIILFREDILRLDSIEFVYYSDGSVGGSFLPGGGEAEPSRGLEVVKSWSLLLTSPDLPGGQKEIPDSGFAIHFSRLGKIDGMIFVYQDRVYKLLQINAEIQGKVLVDYTQNEISLGTPLVMESPQQWKTYTNTAMGFSIEHPVGYQVDEFQGAVVIYKGEKKQITPNSPVDPYPQGTSISIYDRGSDCGDCYSFKLEETKIAGYRAQRVLDVTSFNDIYIYNTSNTKVFRIGFVSDSELEQILSTFRFAN